MENGKGVCLFPNRTMSFTRPFRLVIMYFKNPFSVQIYFSLFLIWLELKKEEEKKNSSGDVPEVELKAELSGLEVVAKESFRSGGIRLQLWWFHTEAGRIVPNWAFLWSGPTGLRAARPAGQWRRQAPSMAEQTLAVTREAEASGGRGRRQELWHPGEAPQLLPFCTGHKIRQGRPGMS